MKTLFDAAGLRVFERGWLSSNNVMFAGDAHHASVLVDTGYASHAAQTVALVHQALGTRPLDRIVNTHLHSDHCGGNAALQLAFGTQVAVPVAEKHKVDAWDEDALSFRVTGQQCPRFSGSGVLVPGQPLQLGSREWDVIAAPGHDPASVMLFEPELGLLISADGLWENGFGVVFPEIEGVEAFEEVRATLEAIARLPVRCVIPGHGRPFTDAAAALERAHRRLDGLVQDPVRHAMHAAKVLVKFHLLEVQQEDVDTFARWMADTPHLHTIHQRFFEADASWSVWTQALLAGLTKSNALAMRDGMVLNC